MKITHDQAESAVHHLTGHTSGDLPLEYYKTIKAYIAQQRAASVRVVRPIETVIHPGGRHSTPEVFDLKPGQEIAVIERRAEAAAGEGA